jgi:hypothetical protein
MLLHSGKGIARKHVLLRVACASHGCSALLLRLLLMMLQRACHSSTWPAKPRYLLGLGSGMPYKQHNARACGAAAH